MPGKKAIHQASFRYSRPSATIAPPAGLGGWTPAPQEAQDCLDQDQLPYTKGGDNQDSIDNSREDVHE